jgi:hypothetical protein
MTISYDELQSDRYAWNSFPGNVHGLLLDRRQPALTLCSYKFYLTQTVTFTVLADDRQWELPDIRMVWLPHKVQCAYCGPDGELTLEAMFGGEELLAVRYTISGHEKARLVTLRITGIARNGEDNKQLYRYHGGISSEQGLPLVKQTVEIPDYYMHQVGPVRRATHHLCWLAGASAPAEISSAAIATSDPYYLDQTNLSGSWQVQQMVTLPADGGHADTLYLAVRWLGVSQPHRRDIYELRDQIDAARRRNFADLEQARREYFEDLLQKLPGVKAAFQANHQYLVLYAQAWICIWQNITGDLVTSRKTLPAPSAFVSKVVDNGFGPAQWETSLAGYLVSFINPDLGVNILESVLACVEEDGFLPEDLIFNRDIKLASLEPSMLEEIYRRTGRTDFLARNYERLYRQLLFHLKHPGFHYLTPGGGHLSIQNFYSLLALERIARVIGRPAAHLAELQLWKDEMVKALDQAFEKQARTGPVFQFLHQYADAATAQSILDRVRAQHMVPADRYFMYHHPDGIEQPSGRENLDSYKMVHFFHFILGLEKYGELELLASLTAATYRGLRQAGDFWECYYVTGEPWGNGPMSIFGAFGWIWLLLDKPVDFPIRA